jgi:hypothetical protein
MTKRSNYFDSVYWILLIVVFLGFAPSFYLKFFVTDQPFYPTGLPIPHVVHGIILTIWYIFLVVQSRWITVNDFSTHRKTGWFGVAWAVLVIVSTVWVISIFPDRMVTLAHQTNSTVEELEPDLLRILWMDIFMSILFIAFFLTGIIKRNTPHIHKRVMLYTGIVFLFAATGRLGGITSYYLNPIIGFVIGVGILFALTVSLLIYDYRQHKKIHRISWICFALYWGLTFLSFYIAETAFGNRLVNLL